MHAGLVKSTVQIESSVASPPVFVVKEPLMSGSLTSDTDRVNTTFELQSLGFASLVPRLSLFFFQLFACLVVCRVELSNTK